MDYLNVLAILAVAAIGSTQYWKMVAYKGVATSNQLAAQTAGLPFNAMEKAQLSSDFTALWMMFTVLLVLPAVLTFNPALLNGFSNLFTEGGYWSMGKGLNNFVIIMAIQLVTGASLSSNAFWGFLSVALGTLALVVTGVLSGLSLPALVGIFGLGIMGLLFLRFGHANTLSRKSLFWLGVCLLCSTYNVVADTRAIPQLGWYAHMVTSYGVMFILCFIRAVFQARLAEFLFKVAFRKENLNAGAAYGISEMVLTPSMQYLLPVPVAFTAMRFANLGVMLNGALKHNESTWRNQLLLGVPALALAILVVVTR